MLIGENDRTKCGSVRFVSYSGRGPNLCRGTLVLNIDGKYITFGSYHGGNDTSSGVTYDRFWTSGGDCGFRSGYDDPYTTKGEWIIYENKIPEEYRKYAVEIDTVFNNNVEYGCCGGCL